MTQIKADKVYSHGCVKTRTGLFVYLIKYRSRGKLTIKTRIDYPTYSSSTYGITDK